MTRVHTKFSWLGFFMVVLVAGCSNRASHPIDAISEPLYVAARTACVKPGAPLAPPFKLGPTVFSRTGQYIAALCAEADTTPQRYKVDLLQTASWDRLPVFAERNQEHWALGMDISPDDQWAAVATQDGVWLQNLSNGSTDTVNLLPAAGITTAVTFSPLGQWLAVGKEGEVVVMDAQQKKWVTAFALPHRSLLVSKLAFSPDDTLLLALYADASVENAPTQLLVWKMGEGLPQTNPWTQQSVLNADFESLDGPLFGDTHHHYMLAIFGYNVSDFDKDHHLAWGADKLYLRQVDGDSGLTKIAWSPDLRYYATLKLINAISIFSRDPEKFPVPLVSADWSTADGQVVTVRSGNLFGNNVKTEHFLDVLFTPDGEVLLARSDRGFYRWTLTRRP